MLRILILYTLEAAHICLYYTLQIIEIWAWVYRYRYIAAHQSQDRGSINNLKFLRRKLIWWHSVC